MIDDRFDVDVVCFRCTDKKCLTTGIPCQKVEDLLSKCTSSKRAEIVEVPYDQTKLELAQRRYEAKSTIFIRDLEHLSSEYRQMISSALSKENILTKRQRVCLWLFFFDSVPQTVIAKSLNITAYTVKFHISQGLKKVKKFLTKEIIPGWRKCAHRPCTNSFMFDASCPLKRFCSKTCYRSNRHCRTVKRRAARRWAGKKPRICAWSKCGKEFMPSIHNIKYCSKKCRIEARNERFGYVKPWLKKHSIS